MEYINGDLIQLAKEGVFDIIVHGCNCFNTMGAGIAKQIKSNFPEAYKADLKTTKGDKEKLGNYSSVIVDQGTKNFTIINAYTQYSWYGAGVKVDYSAIRSVFRQINNKYKDKCIGIPLIGAGLAGGNWDRIQNTINYEVTDSNITVVKYKAQ